MISPRHAIPAFAILMIPFLFGQQPGSAVAVVSEMQGTASAATPDNGRTILKLFDWLGAGSSVEVDGDSRVVLAFSNGNRYELPTHTRVRLLDEGVEKISGTVKTLDPFPPMPHFPAIAASPQLGARSGAIRVRGAQEFKRLYPCNDSATLPESTILMYSAMPQASRYHVVLKDESGRSILDMDTAKTEVSIPPGTMTEGSQYSWSVEAKGTLGVIGQGQCGFSTLPQESIRERALLKQHLEMKGDARSLALLAAIDERLGLLLEAKKEFEAASTKSGPNLETQSIIKDIENRLP
jgi:hypothetical protein